ncbi:MAG: M23 family metallopeptidase, partial [Leptolyngbya sp. DLM2.Bin15]
MPSERPVSEAPQPIYSTTPDVMFEDNGAGVSAPMSVNDLMQNPPRLAGGSDIDSANDYNLGATYAPDQVGSVVLSERSTGCQTTLERGQDLASLCAPSASSSGQSVNLGPISVGPDGVSMNRLPSFDNFYNVTTRPISQPNNGDRHLLFPLSIPAPITSLFGWRQHPIFGDARFHAGIDLGAPMGTPVVAAFSGKVVTAEYLQGYGLTVVLMHNNGTQETLYAHLSEIFVRTGDTVAQGEVVGRVGSTGNSTGPHLHFEVRELENGTWVTLNPAPSLQMALNNFINGFDGLQVAQVWSKTGLQAGLARSEKHREIWMPLAVQVGMFAPVPQKPDFIPPEQMERVVVSKSLPGSEALV